jgi:hypothetical protein
MMSQERRNRVEANALLLDHARWLLERAFLQLITLADIQRTHRINRIITSVDIERRRWLRAADSPTP